MNERRNKQLYFLAGAVLGGLSAYYLTTPQGKKLRKDIANKTNEVANTVSEKAGQVADTVTEKANRAIEEVNKVTADSMSKMKNMTDSLKSDYTIETQSLNEDLSDMLNDSFSQIEEGVKAAKKKLKNGIA